MKGISTILATILIVIIVVALVSLTYTFAISLFGTSSRGVETGVTETTIRLDKRVEFVVDPSCSNVGGNWQIAFSIRHAGATYNISSAEISAFFGNEPGTISGWGSEPLTPGSVKTLTFRNSSAVNWSKTDLFTVSAPANPTSKTVTCP
jgi:FlaG/FlaF family flagellin (archaellin)